MVGNGENFKFWEDVEVGELSLSGVFPPLHSFTLHLNFFFFICYLNCDNMYFTVKFYLHLE